MANPEHLAILRQGMSCEGDQWFEPPRLSPARRDEIRKLTASAVGGEK